MELYVDQQDFKGDLRNAFRASKAVVGVAPTGFGKTAVTASILADATGTVWFVVHRRELVHQSIAALKSFGLDPGVIAAGAPYEPHKRVFVVMAPTASRRLKTLPAPDFIVFDECVTGDSIIDTDVGPIQIKDAIDSGAKTVLSYDGMSPIMKPISGIKQPVQKDVLSVVMEHHQIKCTSDHLFYTSKGWVEAKNLKPGQPVCVLVDAESKPAQTAGVGLNCIKTAIGRARKNPKASGTAITQTSSATSHCVPADAERRCCPLTKALNLLYKTGATVDMADTCKAINGINEAVIFLLTKTSNKQYLGHSLETLVFYSLISAQRTLDLHLTTAPSKRSGRNTKRPTYPLSAWKLNIKKILDGETFGQQECRLAVKNFLMFTKSHIAQEEKKLQDSGLICSAQSGWLGGMEMTAPIPKGVDTPTSIQRALAKKKLLQSMSSFVTILEKRLSSNTEDTTEYSYDKNHQKGYGEQSRHTCQSFLGTKWETVKEVKKYSAELVYDISVDDTHCYFANGILVHNCHHVVGQNTWGRIIHHYPDSPILGLTATPERLDGRGLGEHFDTLVEGPPVDWLIKKGRLSDYNVYAPSIIPTKGLHIQRGEYAASEVEAAIEDGAIIGDAIESYKRYGCNRPGIVFAPTRSASKATVAQFCAQGIRAAHLDGETPDQERDNTLEDYRNGKLDLISNVGLFGEGFDVPKAKILIDLAPTASLGRAMQRWGRVLRYDDSDRRPACILDHAGNIMRHGLPDDPREWSLDAPKRKRTTGEATTAIRQCSNCYAIHRPAPRCPYCGFTYSPDKRQVRTVDGDLVQLDKDALRKAQKEKKQEQAKARTLQELIELGIKRGYKNPAYWAKKVWYARHARR